jgi:hypothetical protein
MGRPQRPQHHFDSPICSNTSNVIVRGGKYFLSAPPLQRRVFPCNPVLPPLPRLLFPHITVGHQRRFSLKICEQVRWPLVGYLVDHDGVGIRDSGGGMTGVADTPDAEISTNNAASSLTTTVHPRGSARPSNDDTLTTT